MDCILPGASVHGILQASILEWVAISLLQGIFPTQELYVLRLVGSGFLEEDERTNFFFFLYIP